MRRGIRLRRLRWVGLVVLFEVVVVVDVDVDVGGRWGWWV